jgi:hypothetical protein
VDERRVLGGEVASSSGFLVSWSTACIVVNVRLEVGYYCVLLGKYARSRGDGDGITDFWETALIELAWGSELST